MFIYGNIEDINREQHIDRLRRIARDRLVSEVELAKPGPGFWMGFHRGVYSLIQKLYRPARSARVRDQIGSPPARITRS